VVCPEEDSSPDQGLGADRILAMWDEYAQLCKINPGAVPAFLARVKARLSGDIYIYIYIYISMLLTGPAWETGSGLRR
jgi:hypothetical protein